MLRHRDWEQCPQGALEFYVVSRFHGEMEEFLPMDGPKNDWWEEANGNNIRFAQSISCFFICQCITICKFDPLNLPFVPSIFIWKVPIAFVFSSTFSIGVALGNEAHFWYWIHYNLNTRFNIQWIVKKYPLGIEKYYIKRVLCYVEW